MVWTLRGGTCGLLELPLVGGDFIRGLNVYEKNSVVYVDDVYV